MAWDDTPPDATDTASTSWDQEPPKPDELPKSLTGFGQNLVSDVKGNAKGLLDLGQGLMEHPIDTVSKIPAGLIGEGKRIGLGELLTGHPINAGSKFLDAAYDKPLSTALDVAPVVGAAGKALGIGGAAAGGAEEAANAAKLAEAGAESVPHGTIVESADALQVPKGGTATGAEALSSLPPGTHAPMAENASAGIGAAAQNELSQLYTRLRQAGKTHEEALHDLQQSKISGTPSGLPKTSPSGMGVPSASSKSALPIVEPGAKTGAPHALFAYNDKFGPGGTERSIYNIFGDPEHPTLKAAGGHGSSVPADILEKNGIPVVGREPRSVGKWEPLESPASPPPSGEAPPAGATGAPPPPPDAAFTDNVAQKAKEVNGYINQKYGNFSKKPGAVGDLADYVQEKSQMMSAQQMGFTPLQNRQLGATPTEQIQAMRAIGQYGIDSDIVSPTGGLRHMVESNKRLLDQAGKTIGDLRKEADARFDPKTMVMDPLQEIHQKLDSVFSRGTRSGETGAYQKALQTVEDGKPTFEGMADVSTKLNKAANEANRLQQPHGAFTDVANIISRIENERIRSILGPQKASMYDQALKEFGINKKIEAALKRKVGGEVKRMGPGSLTSNMTQKLLDEVGYRVGARAANKVSGAILKNPAAAKSLPSLFKEFANHIDDATNEVSGMYKGGRVPDDVKQYVSSRC